MAAQMRRSAVLRSVNLRTGLTPGSLFQIATNLSMGQSAETDAKSFSVANRVPSRHLRACSLEAYALARLAESMTNVFMTIFTLVSPWKITSSKGLCSVNIRSTD